MKKTAENGIDMNNGENPPSGKARPGIFHFFAKRSVAKSSQSKKSSENKKIKDKNPIFYILELLPLIFLALYMGAPYLDFTQNIYPNGYEYILVTVTHYVWNLLPKCGTCVVWNGLLNNGMPAFAELSGAVLHPLVVITSLLWGVINGSKIIILVSLIMSGIAMWWFALELEVRRLPRIWISLFGVVGGHLIGRLDSGNILFMLTVASTSLLFPMVLRLNKQPTNRRIAVLAILMALTWLSGGGYIQIGIVLAWFPAFLLLLYEAGKKKQEKWIAFGKSVFISGVLCGILFLPAAHFGISGMEKDACPDLPGLQPIRYVPLNLVIGDSALMGQKYLGMDTFPYEHINFIGWTPVVFAIIAGYFVFQKKKKRIFAAIYLSILLSLIFSSREIYLFLMPYLPFLNKLCSMSVSTSLMVPPILAMAAWGVDRLLNLKWPEIAAAKVENAEGKISVSLKWFILIPVLVLAFKNIIPFDKIYLNVHKVEIPSDQLAYAQINDTQWVNPPTDWIPTLLNEDRKIIMWERHVIWEGRQRLPGYIGFINNPDNSMQIIAQEKDFDVIRRPDEVYASVNIDNKLIKCDAISMGGDINVTCDTSSQAVLKVLEYQYSGWYAWVDGVAQPLLGGDWLSVNAPAGKHTYTFRYRPWDVYLGAFISLIGIGLVLLLLIAREDRIE